MEIYIGNQLFDTKCPKFCSGINKNFTQGQGGLCHRCPIFNCVPAEDGFCLIEPSNYRQDWAKEWRNWFDNGCKDYPVLKLSYEKK